MQTDFFETATVNASSIRTNIPKPSFLERYRFDLRLDHLVIGAISLLVLFVFVFSFGVENGKKFAMAELRAEREKREKMVEELRTQVFATAETNATTTPVTPAASVPVVAKDTKVTPKIESVPAKPAAVPSENSAGNFTIQMITYASKDAAEKNVQALSEKGHHAFIIPASKLFQVCVDSFDTRAHASQAMSKLKAEGIVPDDAYVRSIPKV